MFFFSFFREMKNVWFLEPDEAKGEVTCLDCYDMTGDGANELIIGRGDGTIEVYTMPHENDTIPKQIYSYVSRINSPISFLFKLAFTLQKNYNELIVAEINIKNNKFFLDL